MKLIVVGAAGGVGRQVVEQGLGHGHEIVAFVSSRPLELTHERLAVVRGDTRDRDAMAQAVEGADAVVAALGGPGEVAGARSRSEAADAVISAMKLCKVRRLVAQSAAGVGESRDSVPLTYRARIATQWRDVFVDLAAMEELVLLSGLDWTVVRPAALTDGPLTGLYRTRENVLPEGGRSISRPDVAALMLKALSGRRYIERIVAAAD